MKKFYNLNKESIYLSTFNFGKTYNIEIKIGKKFYILDVDKNRISAHIDFYKKSNSRREFYSKYDDSYLVCLSVEKNSILDKKFFENIKVIACCKEFLEEYRNILHK